MNILVLLAAHNGITIQTPVDFFLESHTGLHVNGASTPVERPCYLHGVLWRCYGLPVARIGVLIPNPLPTKMCIYINIYIYTYICIIVMRLQLYVVLILKQIKKRDLVSVVAVCCYPPTLWLCCGWCGCCCLLVLRARCQNFTYSLA